MCHESYTTSRFKEQTRGIFFKNIHQIGIVTRGWSCKNDVQMMCHYLYIIDHRALQLPPRNTATPKFWCVEKVFGNIEIVGKGGITK